MRFSSSFWCRFSVVFGRFWSEMSCLGDVFGDLLLNTLRGGSIGRAQWRIPIGVGLRNTKHHPNKPVAAFIQKTVNPF